MSTLTQLAGIQCTFLEVGIPVEMTTQLDIGKKGISLFKQLPWVEQMEAIKKYISNPKYPTACYPDCVTGTKKKDF